MRPRVERNATFRVDRARVYAEEGARATAAALIAYGVVVIAALHALPTFQVGGSEVMPSVMQMPMLGKSVPPVTQ